MVTCFVLARKERSRRPLQEGWRGRLEAGSDEILNSVIGPDEIHLYTNPAGEHRDFLDCVNSRKDPYFPVDIGHRVSSICHLANIAIKLGRSLKWDPARPKVAPLDNHGPGSILAGSHGPIVTGSTTESSRVKSRKFSKRWKVR